MFPRGRILLSLAVLLASCGDSGTGDETLAAGKARACFPWDCDDKERCRSVQLDRFDFDNGCFTTSEYACFERESCVEGEFYAQGNDRTVRVRGCVNIDFWADWVVVDEPPQETLSTVETSCWDLLASIEENCERYSPEQCPTEERCIVYERETITDFDSQTGCPIEETISECIGVLPGYSGRIQTGTFVFEGCEE